MPQVGRQVDVIAWNQAPARAVVELELGMPGEDRHPLVLILVVPLSAVAEGHDALNPRGSVHQKHINGFRADRAIRQSTEEVSIHRPMLVGRAVGRATPTV